VLLKIGVYAFEPLIVFNGHGVLYHMISHKVNFDYSYTPKEDRHNRLPCQQQGNRVRIFDARTDHILSVRMLDGM